jgi:hypothetical protein
MPNQISISTLLLFLIFVVFLLLLPTVTGAGSISLYSQWLQVRSRVEVGLVVVSSAVKPKNTLTYPQLHPSHFSCTPPVHAPLLSSHPSPTWHRHLQNGQKGNLLLVFNNKSTSSISIVPGHFVDGVIMSRVLPKILQDVRSGSRMRFSNRSRISPSSPLPPPFLNCPSQVPSC